MTPIHYNDRGPAVLALQRGILAAGGALPRYGADGHLGGETWAALVELGARLGVRVAPVDLARAGRAAVPPEVVAHCAEVLAAQPRPARIWPCETTRPWPTRGARAWLATRAEGARLHAGVDLGGTDDRIVAPEPVRVELVLEASYGGRTPRYSRPAGWGGYGPHAVLCRALEAGAPVERWHLLAHVDRVSVEAGAVLAQGDLIARVAPIGAHLHWEVRVAAKPPAGWAAVEIALDPGRWLAGEDYRWQHGRDPCPPKPERTARTPRACRPR